MTSKNMQDKNNDNYENIKEELKQGYEKVTDKVLETAKMAQDKLDKNDEKLDKFKEGLKNGYAKATDKIVETAKTAKEKYDKADEKTKKSIIGGVAAGVGILVGLVGLKKMLSKKRKDE